MTQTSLSPDLEAVDTKAVKILDVGSGYESVAEQVFTWIEDKEIVRLDGNPAANPDVLHDITEPLPEELRSSFDIVYVSHILEHIDRMKVIDTFRNISGAVRNMGEVWVVVPSLEWAANEIINRREGIHVQGVLYGGQDHPLDYHRVGFTLASLRQMVELCGLIVRKSYQSPFTTIFDNKSYQCLQNVVIGMRYDLANDPAAAIE